MKEKWTYKKLGEVAAFIGDGDWIESRHQSELGIRLIQTGNIGNGVFKAKEDKPHYISEQTFNELDCTEIYSGDCLVSRLPDPIGRACIIPEIGCRMITAVDCTIIRFNEILYPQFFVYYTGSKEYEREIRNHTTGSTRKRISRKNLELVKIPVPSLETQQHIISELDLLQSIIDKQQAQLKELDKLAQAVFYDMFGDPVENEKAWEVKKLEEIGKVVTGNTPSTKDEENYSFNDYSFVKPSDIAKEGVSIIESTEYHISTKAFNQSRQLTEGSVLTTCIGIIGKVGILKQSATCNQQINAIIPSDKIEPYYLAYTMIEIRSLLEAMANAPVVPIINKGDFSKVEIPVPPLSLQQSFAAKIEFIEKQKAAISQSMAETQKLFDYTMDKYFG